MKRVILWAVLFLARYHISDRAVCRMSAGRKDYHEAEDAGIERWHEKWMTCRRCGREFFNKVRDGPLPI